jgi:ribosome biogenesis GTPase A
MMLCQPPCARQQQQRAHLSPTRNRAQCNTVQWYPGHIAKAERHLKEQLKMVDLVLEVRDARIPLSTCHPQVRVLTYRSAGVMMRGCS